MAAANEAWGGDAALRRAVLEQLSAHLAVGRLATVAVGEASLRVYAKDGLAAVSSALHLPEAVLRVGYTLWEGFQDFGPARQTIEEAREVYRAIAPGADLSGFREQFAAWVLADPDHGFVRVLPPALAELAQDDADALLLGLELGESPPGADPTGFLAARKALILDEVGALACLADLRLAATKDPSDEKIVLDAMRDRFQRLVG